MTATAKADPMPELCCWADGIAHHTVHVSFIRLDLLTFAATESHKKWVTPFWTIAKLRQIKKTAEQKVCSGAHCLIPSMIRLEQRKDGETRTTRKQSDNYEE